MSDKKVDFATWGEAEIEHSLLQPALNTYLLCNTHFRQHLINHITADPLWGLHRILPAIQTLRNQAQKVYDTAPTYEQDKQDSRPNNLQPFEHPSYPDVSNAFEELHYPLPLVGEPQISLEEALVLLATQAIATCLALIQNSTSVEENFLQQSTISTEIDAIEVSNITILLLLIDACLLRQDPEDIWKYLFDQVKQVQETIIFLHTHWRTFFWLLKRWNATLPNTTAYDQAMKPFLNIPREHLELFLQLDLQHTHPAWYLFMISQLAADLTPKQDKQCEQNPGPKTYTVFICYASEDEKLLEQLKNHLEVLQRSNVISLWYNRNISAGKNREEEILQHLATADIILLLISPDFMSSEYSYGVEMVRAMERQERKEAIVIPIILRPVYWQTAPFGKLEVLPRNAKPIVSSHWRYQDEAFYEVAEGICNAIQTLQA